MIRRALFPLLCCQLIASGASAAGAFETARTLPDGATRFGFGLTATNVSSGTTSSWGKTGELSGRLGLSRLFDLGLLVALPEFSFDTPSFAADVRFQLVSVQGFAMNLAFGVSYTLSTVSGVSLSILSILPEFNVGYDFNQYVAIYLAGRDTTPVSASLNGTSVATSSTFSTTLGFRFGDTWGLRAEGGLYFSLASGGGSGAILAGTLFFGSGNRLQASTEVNRRAENWKDRQAERSPRERVSERTRAARSPSRVMKVRTANKIALLSQPEGNPWRRGERVCLFRQGESVACGTITKSDSTGAVLNYTSGGGEIGPGLDAFPAGGFPSPGARGRAEPPPESDDLGDPTLEDLP